MVQERTYEPVGSVKGREVSMYPDEMERIASYLVTISNSFHSGISPRLQALANTAYYEGGEASKMLAHYPIILNKVNELGDLYAKASSEVVAVMYQWLEQDATLDRDFRASFQDAIAPLISGAE